MRSFGLISYLFLGKRGLAARARRYAARIRALDATFNARYSRYAGVGFLRHRSVSEGRERSRRGRRSVHCLGFPVIVPLFLMLLVFAGALLHG